MASKLTRPEREKFNRLVTEAERNAFRITRNWSQTTKPDFKIRCESLGQRLGISLKGASKLRRKFCELEILRETAAYVPHKLCARYEWIASREQEAKAGALISQQWKGDPGDARLRKSKKAA